MRFPSRRLSTVGQKERTRNRPWRRAETPGGGKTRSTSKRSIGPGYCAQILSPSGLPSAPSTVNPPSCRRAVHSVMIDTSSSTTRWSAKPLKSEHHAVPPYRVLPCESQSRACHTNRTMQMRLHVWQLSPLASALMIALNALFPGRGPLVVW